MCGIIGCVGVPENPILSYNLLTALLCETQRRGKHATGFYGVSLQNKILYDKMPVEAMEYVKFREWKMLIEGTKALIGHCRFATQGNVLDNRNNHPFVSKTNKIGLIHNGILYLYDKYKAKYKRSLESECDSELLLRIICREKDALTGIKKVFSLLGPRGDFSCEMIHAQQNGKILFYIFRDDGRPGKFIDAFKETGQYFFCSEADIWKDALKDTGTTELLGHLKVEDVPPYQVWVIDSDSMKIFKIKLKPPVKTRTYATTVYHGGGYQGGSYIPGVPYTPPNKPYCPPVNYHSSNISKYSHGSKANVVPVSNLTKQHQDHLRIDWEETRNNLGLPRFTEKKKVEDESYQR
jgi:glutamine phosphoribosylpyrophosphate amidotransferase